MPNPNAPVAAPAPVTPEEKIYTGRVPRADIVKYANEHPGTPDISVTGQFAVNELQPDDVRFSANALRPAKPQPGEMAAVLFGDAVRLDRVSNIQRYVYMVKAKVIVDLSSALSIAPYDTWAKDEELSTWVDRNVVGGVVLDNPHTIGHWTAVAGGDKERLIGELGCRGITDNQVAYDAWTARNKIKSPAATSEATSDVNDTLVFSARNSHVKTCGTPPVILAADYVYAGYFQNQHGEQWTLSLDKDQTSVRLQGGDAGWELGHYADMSDKPNTRSFGDLKTYIEDTLIPKFELELDVPEVLWLTACLMSILAI